jgi:hypothetical protein
MAGQRNVSRETFQVLLVIFDDLAIAEAIPSQGNRYFTDLSTPSFPGIWLEMPKGPSSLANIERYGKEMFHVKHSRFY